MHVVNFLIDDGPARNDNQFFIKVRLFAWKDTLRNTNLNIGFLKSKTNNMVPTAML